MYIGDLAADSFQSSHPFCNTKSFNQKDIRLRGSTYIECHL